MITRFAAAALVLGAVAATPTPAPAQSYFLNGTPMSPGHARALAGLGLPPGNYRVDGQGFVYPPGHNQPFTRIPMPPAGYGHQHGPIAQGQANPDGSSSVYIPNPSGAPGVSGAQDSDGCIYFSNGYSPNC